MKKTDRVINLDDFRSSYLAEVICTKCLHRWIAVWPVGIWLKDLECPNCGPGYVIKTGQDLEDDDEQTN